MPPDVRFATGPARLDDPQVLALIELHQRGMLADSPPGTCFALDLTGLRQPKITMFGAWDGERLAAIGALKRLSSSHAEIKSMRADPAFRGKGAGRAVLEAIIAAAQADGIERISLETGTSEAFAPAISLYRAFGFRSGEGFAGYANGPHNQCYHLEL